MFSADRSVNSARQFLRNLEVAGVVLLSDDANYLRKKASNQRAEKEKDLGPWIQSGIGSSITFRCAWC